MIRSLALLTGSLLVAATLTAQQTPFVDPADDVVSMLVGAAIRDGDIAAAETSWLQDRPGAQRGDGPQPPAQFMCQFAVPSPRAII